MSPIFEATATNSHTASAISNHCSQPLSAERVRLRPTRQALFYLALIVTMLVSSLNYQNNLGILTSLFFLSCLLLSALQGRQLLHSITLSFSKIEPVFCNNPAHISITITTHKNFKGARLLLRIDNSGNNSSDKSIHMTDSQEQTLNYAIPTSHRGEHLIQSIRLSSLYPFGVMQACANFHIEQRFIVYPDPDLAEKQDLYSSQRQHHDQQDFNQSDFAGMRSYSPGDPFKLINWKTAASEKGLHINIFSSNIHSEGWIDWDDYPGMNTEQRLSLMTRAVIEHEKRQCNYGLRLANTIFRPRCGVTHMKQCLTALALFNSTPTPE